MVAVTRRTFLGWAALVPVVLVVAKPGRWLRDCYGDTYSDVYGRRPVPR